MIGVNAEEAEELFAKCEGTYDINGRMERLPKDGIGERERNKIGQRTVSKTGIEKAKELEEEIAGENAEKKKELHQQIIADEYINTMQNLLHDTSTNNAGNDGYNTSQQQQQQQPHLHHTQQRQQGRLLLPENSLNLQLYIPQLQDYGRLQQLKKSVTTTSYEGILQAHHQHLQHQQNLPKIVDEHRMHQESSLSNTAVIMQQQPQQQHEEEMQRCLQQEILHYPPSQQHRHPHNPHHHYTTEHCYQSIAATVTHQEFDYNQQLHLQQQHQQEQQQREQQEQNFMNYLQHNNESVQQRQQQHLHDVYHQQQQHQQSHQLHQQPTNHQPQQQSQYTREAKTPHLHDLHAQSPLLLDPQQQQREYSPLLEPHVSHLSPSKSMKRFNSNNNNASNITNSSTNGNTSNNAIVAIDELLIDDFADDPNVSCKLLSPTNVKHENQDDGYETSAGDVLTPNSHSSSMHSVTPQHQLQHAALSLPTISSNNKNTNSSNISSAPVMTQKCEDQQQSNMEIMRDHLNSEIEIERSSAAGPYNFVTTQIEANNSNNNNNNNSNNNNNNSNNNNNNSNNSNSYMLATDHVSNVAATHRSDETEIFSIETSYPTNQLHDLSHKNNEMASTGHSQKQQQNLEQQQAQTFAISSADESQLQLSKPPQKKRGRKKKNQALDVLTNNGIPSLNTENLNNTTDAIASGSAMLIKSKERKKHDRFNGMPEEEVVKRTLPDHLCDNLDIVIIGINPGLFAAYKGHHYAGPGNHFWKCLYLSGLTQEQMSADEDYKLMKYGIGFTNMVQRATKGSADLTRKEIKEGSRILLEKLQKFRPKIAVFNGKLIFEVFSGNKDFNFGRQPECVQGTNTYIWVMPSSSARCAQLPRAADKVPFYAALKKFRDYLNGLISHISDAECVFTEHRIKQSCEQENRKIHVTGVGETTSLLYGSEQTISNAHGSIVNEVGIESAAGAEMTVDPSGVSLEDNTNHLQQQQEKLPQFVALPTSRNSTPTAAAMSYNIYGGSSDGVRERGASGPGSRPVPPILEGIRLPQTNSNGYIMPFYHGQSPTAPEKKKRGRPKKIRGQEIIQMGSAEASAMQQSSIRTSSNNILNLSLMVANNGETPKKKRGRPKKLKPHPDILMVRPLSGDINLSTETKPNPMPIQELTSDEVNPTAHRQQQQQQLLYNDTTKTPSIDEPQRLYSTTSVSPMRSPILNCSYATITPPIGPQTTPPPPIHLQQHGEPSLSENLKIATATTSVGYFMRKLTDINSPIDGGQSRDVARNGIVNEEGAPTATAGASVPHLGESPPPSSPNISTVDFEPPTGPMDGQTIQQEGEGEMETLHQRMHQQQHTDLQQQQSDLRYDSPANDKQMGDPFQQWLSPQHQTHHHHLQAIGASYQQQHQQQHQQQQQQQHNQRHLHDLQYQEHHQLQQHLQYLQHQQTHLPPAGHLPWQRDQRYDETNANYLLSVLQPSQQQQQSTHHPQNHQQPHQSTHPIQQLTHPHQIHQPPLELAHHHLHHNQQQHTLLDHQITPQSSTTDVSTKSLSGLESLVDQIPTITEGETSAAASKSGMGTTGSPQQQPQSSILYRDHLLSHPFTGTVTSASNPLDDGRAVGELIPIPNAANGSGHKTHHLTSNTAGGVYGSHSPGNYNISRLNATNSTASPPVLMSPRQQQHQPQTQQSHSISSPYRNSPVSRMMADVLPSTSSTDRHTLPELSPGEGDNSPCTPPLSAVPVSAAMAAVPSVTSSAAHHPIQHSNFSVSNLAASSAPPGTEDAYATVSSYHHSKLMAAAALAAAAANSSTNLGISTRATPNGTASTVAVTHPQLYMDPHASSHMSHVQVNTVYPSHPHAHPHHHHFTSYGSPVSHDPLSGAATDPYCHPYGSVGSGGNAAVAVAAAAAAAAAAVASGSPTTLHMPSPNYPYGYGSPAATATANYTHQSTPPPPSATVVSSSSNAHLSGGASAAAAVAAAAAAAVAYHGHHSHHPHSAPHHRHPHLSIFNRLKQPGIGGYGSF